MQKFFSVAALVLFVFFVANSDKAPGPLPIGSSIPNAEKKMKDVSGKEISLNDARGKQGLLVMFSCNTCPIVRAYQPRTREVCNYADEKKIGVVLLNSNEASRDDGDSFEDMKSYATEQSYHWPYVVDQGATMADAFGASRTPECFLFGPSGKLVYRGAIDDNQNGPDDVTRKHLMIAINEMLSGKEITMKTTRSVGCTIKRLNQ